MKRRTFLRLCTLAGTTVTIGLAGCHHKTAAMFYQPPPPPQMLGFEIDQMNEQQELNAEAAKFIVYQHEFDLNSSEGGKSLGGVRLNEAGEDHVRQIAGALKGGATFPVLIERSRTSSRAGTEFNYGVHYNPELDNRRRLVVVKALEKMGVVNAGKVVSVSPSFAQPLTGMEAEQAYRRSLRNNNNGGNGAGGGGGGFGGGGFQ